MRDHMKLSFATIVKSLLNQSLNLNSNSYSKFNLFEKKVGVKFYSEASIWKF